MNKEAKLKYNAGSFEILENGDHVICAVSKAKISLENLKYWSVELQEPYLSPAEVSQKFSNE